MTIIEAFYYNETYFKIKDNIFKILNNLMYFQFVKDNLQSEMGLSFTIRACKQKRNYYSCSKNVTLQKDIRDKGFKLIIF